MKYKELASNQRYQIYALLIIGQTKTKIAEVLGVHKSTISRELRRNKGKRGYRPKQAQEKTDQRKRDRINHKINHETWKWAERHRTRLEHRTDFWMAKNKWNERNKS